MKRLFFSIYIFIFKLFVFSENFENFSEIWIDRALVEQFLNNKKGAEIFFEAAGFYKKTCCSQMVEDLFYKQDFYENLRKKPKKAVISPPPSFDRPFFFAIPAGLYIRGDKRALKNLEKFMRIFPQSPYGILADFLLGWHRRDEKMHVEKNTARAIEHFSKGYRFYEDFTCLEDKWHHLALRMKFEQAKLEWKEAKTSFGTKNKLLLAYAEENLSFLFNKIDKNHEIWRETAYMLVDTILNKGEGKRAKDFLESKENEAILFKNDRFSALFCQKLGEIYREEGDFDKSCAFFHRAEKESLGLSLFNNEEKLDFLIEKSKVLSLMGKGHEAVSLLSHVVHASAISQLRLKALYLRGEELLKMGREDLAKKQWETLSKKGGPWGQKASRRLETLR